MYTLELEKSLKDDMQVLVEKLCVENIEETKQHLDQYFDILVHLSQFSTYRSEKLVQKGVLLNKALLSNGDIPDTEIQTDVITKEEDIQKDEKHRSIEKDSTSIQTEELRGINLQDQDTSVSDMTSKRKMYRFERNLKGGNIPEINVFVPESHIRKNGLEHNCYVYVEKKGEKNYKFELAKPSENPVCPGRVQYNLCKVEKEGNSLVVKTSYESGSILSSEGHSMTLHLSLRDITNPDFNIKEKDLVDIAFPEERPDAVRVIWKSPNDQIEETKITESKAMLASGKKKKESKTEGKSFGVIHKEKVDKTSLRGEHILVVGNEPQKTHYKAGVEERGGEFDWTDAKERDQIQLESKVKNSTMVIFLLEFSGHTGMNKVKEYCKTHNVLFLPTWNSGFSSLMRIAENRTVNLDELKISS
ncbi:DUF2325 domain-containing protein [[Brevibacterium] frigoritolerans]|nr:DUF2325 domain-containing protein [Peribacillus frigoritolerans]